ncbi:MAG: winged helix-turn-helix domain-containing protein [Candidatus Sedimenticola sp. (ex Thyasira tokunagai)]
MRLFLNPHVQSYVRELAQDFDVSPSQVKSELDNLNKSGLLNSERSGRQIFYRANQQHPLFPELQSMVRKSLGMDRIVDSILERLGNLEAAYVVGDYAAGLDSGIIDIVLLGEVDHDNLADLTQKTERYIDRRIRTLVLEPEEFNKLVNQDALKPRLLLWGEDG